MDCKDNRVALSRSPTKRAGLEIRHLTYPRNVISTFQNDGIVHGGNLLGACVRYVIGPTLPMHTGTELARAKAGGPGLTLEAHIGQYISRVMYVRVPIGQSRPSPHLASIPDIITPHINNPHPYTTHHIAPRSKRLASFLVRDHMPWRKAPCSGPQ